MFIHIPYELLVRVSVHDAFIHLVVVVLVVKQHRPGMIAVASGSTRLLEISFQRIRTFLVYHHPDVRFVDTHTESVGGHHHSHLIILPLLLSLVTHGRFQSRVVVSGIDAVVVKHFADVPRTLSTARIYDGSTRHGIENMYYLRIPVGSFAHHISEVLALETHLEDILLPESELLLNVVHHIRSSRSRESEDSHVRFYLPQVPYGEI